MAEVYVNSTTPIKIKTFYGGEVVDIAGQVLVDIYDITEDPLVDPAIDPNLPITQNVVAQKMETDPGSYSINIPYAITSRPRKLKLHWKYSINSSSHGQYTNVDVVTPYCNLNEAIEDLNISTDSSDPNYKSYHELQMAEKYARKVVEDFTGQEFYLFDDTIVVYGDGSDILTLPMRIDTIYQVYADDALLIDDLEKINNWGMQPVVSETGFAIRINRASLVDNTVYVANGMVPPSVNDINLSTIFAKNVRYKIVAKFGWRSIPDEVEQATIQLMGHYFAKDRLWADRYLKNISTFDWDFEYSDEAYKGTGCAYADKLLSEYTLSSMLLI